MVLSEDAERTLLEWPAFKVALNRNASDMHLCVGSPPTLRINGKLERVGSQDLTVQDMSNLLGVLCERSIRSTFFAETPVDLDYTIELPTLRRRLRMNVFRQYHGPSIALRLLSDGIRTLDSLGIPKSFEKMAFERSGLILVTEGTGSGKSTTLNAMIEMINVREQRHIITIEDPIEIIFKNKRALIEQREINTHVADFSLALRSALREAPDVILVGEIRDSPTAAMTLKAAQVGALVMATLHTRSASETITRFLSMFDDSARTGARQQLADCLRAVLCQNLILPANATTRVAACEILVGTTAVRHLIREDRGHLVHSVMEISSRDGMITMEQFLFNLYQDKKLDLQTAYDNAGDKQAFLAQLSLEEQKSLLIEWETEIELRNLEKQRETRGKVAAVRMV